MSTRNDVLWNTTHIWAPGTVPYSQSAIHYPDGYRQDCSGYVSLCWQSGPQGGSTVTLVEDGTMYAIAEDQLLPGDAVGYCGPGTWGDYGHIQTFEGWDGDGYWVWEQTGGGWGPHHNFYSGRPSWYGYSGWRFVNIQGDEEDGMSQREAELAATWTTTGSDVSGWASGYPEADSVKTYANRQVEERLTAKLSDVSTMAYDANVSLRDVIAALRRIERRLRDLEDRDHHGHHRREDVDEDVEPYRPPGRPHDHRPDRPGRRY